MPGQFVCLGCLRAGSRPSLAFQRIIPSIMVGSAVTGALSMLFGCQLLVPHGGIFVLPIPNAVTNLLLYILAIAVGTVVTTGAIFVLKKPVAARSK